MPRVLRDVFVEYVATRFDAHVVRVRVPARVQSGVLEQYVWNVMRPPSTPRRRLRWLAG
jgi:hypothetical protein